MLTSEAMNSLNENLVSVSLGGEPTSENKAEISGNTMKTDEDQEKENLDKPQNPDISPSIPLSKSEDSMKISILEYQKVGEGIFSAYVVYKVLTITKNPQFKSDEIIVLRRFSDFLGLHEKLESKYLSSGRIVPPPPEKNIVGMTKIKISKDPFSDEFIKHRKHALERFLNRLASNELFCHDPDFIAFLQTDGELPKSTQTAMLSTNSVFKILNQIGDKANKMSYKMEDSDQWFEDITIQIESLNTQMKKLYASVEALAHHRKELCQNTAAFAKSAAMLGNIEEHTGLSRVLSQLAELEEKMVQDFALGGVADADYYILCETIKDYLGLISVIRRILYERIKAYQNIQHSESQLAKKQESDSSSAYLNRTGKALSTKPEIKELENRVAECKEHFEMVSLNVRKEISKFEKERIKEFKSMFINYLEEVMKKQQQIVKLWEAFLPEIDSNI